MFIDWWMMAIFAIATGLWSEYRWLKGFIQGGDTVIFLLKQQKIIETNADGSVKGFNKKLVDRKH